MRAILVDFDANFEAGSLDEAYLDVTDYCQQHDLTGTPLHDCFPFPRPIEGLSSQAAAGFEATLLELAFAAALPDSQAPSLLRHMQLQRLLVMTALRPITKAADALSGCAANAA